VNNFVLLTIIIDRAKILNYAKLTSPEFV